MPKTSAGLLLYRFRAAGDEAAALEVFLVHPGGPFWARKDDGAWSIPKGEAALGEDLLARAKQEFHEETGFAGEASFRAGGNFRALPPVKQAGGKIVHAWAVEGDCDAAAVRSNIAIRTG